MQIETATAADLPDIASMMVLLWPECDVNEELISNRALLLSEKDTLLVAKVGEQTAGFIHLSLRYEFVEGTQSSPVGYIEAIYVQKEHRKTGAGRALVAAGENWCRTHGCQEMASDTELENTASTDFHESVGFEAKNRIVCFAKKL